MPTNTAGLFDEVAAELEAAGYKPLFIAAGTREGRPKMHRKSQLFATRGALRAYADLPEVRESLRDQLGARAKATANPVSIFEQEDPLDTPRPVLERMTKEPLPGTESAVYYLTVGSKNQDPRSAFLDGETSFAVAGSWSLVAYSDFLLLMAATSWVETEAELTKLIPVEEEKARKIGRLIGKVL
jgi:hypothetical protein